MEQEEKSQSETTEEKPGGEWHDLTAQTDALVAEQQEARATAPKNPAETPTAELVADYEAILGRIKSWHIERDNYVTQFDTLIVGATVESEKLRNLISARLGMTLNGAEPEARSVSQQRRLAVQRPMSGQIKQRYACSEPGCGKTFVANAGAIGMHQRMHANQRKLGKPAKPFKPVYAGNPAPAIGQTDPNKTRWCDPCGIAIQVKGWGVHQAAHARHGDKLPRPMRTHPERRRAQTREATDKPHESNIQRREREARRPWVWAFLGALSKLEPAKPPAIGEYLKVPNAKHRASVAMSALKLAGYATNRDGLWTVTEKGRQALLAG